MYLQDMTDVNEAIRKHSGSQLVAAWGSSHHCGLRFLICEDFSLLREASKFDRYNKICA